MNDQLLTDTFVELADTLVDEFDLIEFLHRLVQRTVQLLDVSAAGIMMADQRGQLQFMAASDEQARVVELFELQGAEGPCLDCYNSGQIVDHHGEAALQAHWPSFTRRLSEVGFRSAQAIPMRLRGQTIGALNLFSERDRGLDAQALRTGQALADVATIGILQQRAISAQEILAHQLQTALTSRVTLEQAKGVLAERAGLDVDVAFTVMRRHARRNGQQLTRVAEDVIGGRIDLTDQYPPS